MLEIEEKIKENARRLELASRKSKVEAKLSEAARVAAASSSVQESPVSNDDVSISSYEDF